MIRVLILLFSIFLISCGGTKRASMQNMAGHYQIEGDRLNPRFRVFAKDSTNSLYYHVKREQLLYSRKEQTEEKKARVSIRITQKGNFHSSEVLDSFSTYLEFPESLNEKEFSGEINFKSLENTGLLEVRLLDVNKRNEFTTYFRYKKNDPFLTSTAFSLSNGKPLTENFISSNSEIFVESGTFEKKFLVRFYEREFPLPPPPFLFDKKIPFDFTPDSIFSYQSGTPVILERQGLYQFCTDTGKRSAFTLFRFSQDYPLIRKPNQLVEPLRYILTKDEYENITTKPDAKVAVDNFWTNITGNEERAVEVIKKYYGRVETANALFYSHAEGWKTDRGMIYIIFGEPRFVYRDERGETWYYGEDYHNPATTFTFNRISNPFTEHDYRLERKPEFRPFWYRAVDGWREGRMYHEN